MPRVPRLARGNDALTRLALIQREFNRNEVHNPLPGGVDFSIANNCLERGLWEVKLASLEIHASDPLERLTEQRGKTKLLKTEVETYGDFARPDRQPITTAKFNAPGIYDQADSMRFDLSWPAHPSRILWREVSSPRVPGVFPEIELGYENGYRILIADVKLADLPARREAPATEGDVLKLVCGIGTPVIHAPAAERAAEIAEDRPRYLMILDAQPVAPRGVARPPAEEPVRRTTLRDRT